MRLFLPFDDLRRFGRTRGWRTILIATAVCSSFLPAVGQPTVGLFLNTPQAQEGYTLWAPRFETTYLINNEGKVVHTWPSAYQPGNTAYLLPSGVLLRTAKDGPSDLTRFTAGGFGGRVEEIDWDGNVLWSFLWADENKRLHHDIEPLPNGNFLAISWELKTSAEAIQAGRDPALLPDAELWPETIIEVEPFGASGFTIVWEWHVWDHLIQDHDATKDNHGIVADHPELMDINFARSPGSADWLHANAIDYNAELDQIILGSPSIGEFWVIDHSTTTAEAAGHTAGNSGKGGDILYRWGNPQIYGRGSAADQALFNQHHVHWIDPGLPNAGNILIFNNGRNRPGGNYSSIDEIVSPVDLDGDYPLPLGGAYGPGSLLWTYVADPPTDLFSGGLSGAQRLPNGNTLIVEGRGTTTNTAGNFFEVTGAGATVWQYVNPVGNAGPIAQGALPGADQNVFRIFRYPVDYPAFIGKELTPGDPLELIDTPPPTASGAATTAPLTASLLTADSIRVDWDASSCPAFDYNLLFGELSSVSSYSIQGSGCAVGVTGTHDWLNVPSGDLFFVIVGTDDTRLYESSWGLDGSGAERNGTAPSNECGVISKVTSGSCP